MSILGWLFGWDTADKNPNPVAPVIAEDMDRAACHVIMENLPYITENHAVSGDDATPHYLDAAEAKAVAFRQWWNGLPNGPWKRALLVYLECSERGYVAAREELHTHALRDKRQREHEYYRNQNERIKSLASRMPTPP